MSVITGIITMMQTLHRSRPVRVEIKVVMADFHAEAGLKYSLAMDERQNQPLLARDKPYALEDITTCYGVPLKFSIEVEATNP